jgi:hypothetical protein
MVSSLNSSSADDIPLEKYTKGLDYVGNVYLLYQFADQFSTLQLRKDIIDGTWSRGAESSMMLYVDVIFLYSHLPADSPIVDLIVNIAVDLWVEMSDTCPIELKVVKRLPPEFIYRIMLGRQILRRRSGAKTLKRRCAYHEHVQINAAMKACEEESRRSRKAAWHEEAELKREENMAGVG